MPLLDFRWLCYDLTTWVSKWVVFSMFSWRCIFYSWAHSGSGRVRYLLIFTYSYWILILIVFTYWILILISTFTLQTRKDEIPWEYEMYPEPTLCRFYWPNKPSQFKIYVEQPLGKIFRKFLWTYETRESWRAAFAKSGSWSLGVATDSS